MTDKNSEELEDQRIQSVRDERASRLNKPPFQKFRKLYRFAEEWFENVPDARRELKRMIAEIENEERSELTQAVAEERERVRKIIKESLWDCAEHGLPKYEKTDCVECNSALETNVVLEALLASLDKSVNIKD